MKMKIIVTLGGMFLASAVYAQTEIKIWGSCIIASTIR